MSLTQKRGGQQIRQLEDRLGYPLFVRRQRGLTFTPKGEQLRHRQRALGDIQQEIERLGLPASALQVNCLPSFAAMADAAPDGIPSPAAGRVGTAEGGIPAAGPQADGREDIDIAIRYDPTTTAIYRPTR